MTFAPRIDFAPSAKATGIAIAKHRRDASVAFVASGLDNIFLFDLQEGTTAPKTVTKSQIGDIFSVALERANGTFRFIAKAAHPVDLSGATLARRARTGRGAAR